MLRSAKALCLAALLPSAAFAQGLADIGRVATPEEVAAWDIDIRPDGAGLPKGSGDVMTGEVLYTDNCAVCHGDFGEAVGRWPVLAGGFDTLDSEDPVKTVGSYWPYLSTVYDYVHRAMPFGNAQSLTDDEVYAITAYIMYLNDLVDEEFVLSDESFNDVRLPNEANFYADDRATLEYTSFTAEACMSNCKETVEITGRARIIDVTPEETAAAAAEAAPVVEVAAAPEPVALDPELVAAGSKVFRKCKACHAIGEGAKNKSGPILTGILGNPMGGVEGFKYSKALKNAAAEGRVWDEEAMIAFLTKPKAYLKGTKMSFGGLRKEKDRAAIIAYLQSVTE